jgi:hypothetical protein
VAHALSGCDTTSSFFGIGKKSVYKILKAPYFHDKSCTSKGYELNITKALYTKLEATKRAQNMQYELTGGGIVLTADTATFELI